MQVEERHLDVAGGQTLDVRPEGVGAVDRGQELAVRASVTGAPTISTSLTAARIRITAQEGSNSNRRMLNFGARGWAW